MPALPQLIPASTTIGSTSVGYPYTWDGSAWNFGTQMPAGSTNAWEFLDEAITTARATGDVGVAVTSNGTTTQTVGLTGIPADFLDMDTLSIRYSTDQSGNLTNDSAYSDLTVYKADMTTILASKIDLARFTGSAWTVPLGYNRTLSLTLTAAGLAATKAEWEAAQARITLSTSSNMGSDNSQIILVDFRLEGTYTANAPATSDIFKRWNGSAWTPATIKHGAGWPVVGIHKL